MSAKKSFNGAVCFEAALTGLTLLFLMVPVIQMVITAFTVNAFRGIKSGLTTQWLVKVLELYGDTIVRSLGLALMTCSDDAHRLRHRRCSCRLGLGA